MTGQDKKRLWASRVLLAVFLPMLLFSSLHIHDYGTQAEAECAQCVNHLPHTGHLMAQDGAMHSCVLCQFLSLPFLAVTSVAVVLFKPVKTAVSSSSRSFIGIGTRGCVLLRAPPFV